MSSFYGLAATGFAGLAVAGPMDGNPWIQYGALSLCGFMVLFMTKHITETHKAHREERKQCMGKMETMTEKSIESYDNITKELRMRNCMIDQTNVVTRLETALDRLERKA